MPAATSSRRRARAPSSDRIEEAETSQRKPTGDAIEEDQEEEEEQPRRKSKTIKKEKKPTIDKGKGRQRGPDDDGGDGGDDDGQERIDVANFHDQPLIKGDSARIAGLAKDWAAMRHSLHASSYALLNGIGAALAEVEADEKAVAELDKIIKEVIDLEQEMKCHEEVVSNIAQEVRIGTAVDDALGVYERGVKLSVNDYRKKTARQKYAKSAEYAKFQELQFEIRHPDTAMPPITSLLPKEPGDVSDEDDDVEIGGVTQDFRCPLTMRIITKPLTSTVCGHFFSEAIVEYLGPNKTRTKTCPASGCNKSFCFNDLKHDKELTKRAKAAARRQQDKDMDIDEGSDDDSVIE